MGARNGLLDILAGRGADRPAVVCPGGMMSLAVAEVMDAEGVAWPEAHRDAHAMLRLARAMQKATGLDNLAVPFCMTVEAETYGATVDMGSRTVQPRVRKPILPDDAVGELRTPDFESGRARTLLDALRLAKDGDEGLPVVGNLVGPFSLLGMLADPLMVMRWTRRQPERLEAYLDRLTDDLSTFGILQRRAGADVVCIAEPTATGEILGGKMFRKFVLPRLDRLVGRLQSEGAKVIVHICGDVRPIEAELRELHADAVSFDSMVDLVALVAKRPPWQVMGNVDAFLLHRGPTDTIAASCRRLIAGGVRLLAPACGVIPTTPLAHLKTMRATAEGSPLR
ncbi:MAG TPA: uroporphyrinogen decarboxylase family protein [Planctomycetota bacterium]|nr:uroporphyrinogen decarboxylase family protein [Planctomycetota bacterium]